MKPLTRKYRPDQIIDIFETRYTCKSYNPEKSVNPEDLKTLLNVVRLSPSSMGLEPWQVVVIERGEKTKKLQPLCWGVRPDPSHYIVLVGRNAHHFTCPSPYLEHIHQNIQNRPGTLEARCEHVQKMLYQDLGLRTEREIESWVDKQVYIAMGNLLTAAAMLGIDSTPIEGMHYAKVQAALVEMGAFDPDEFHLSGMVTLGYTNRQEHRPKTRRPLEEVVTYLD